MISFIQSITTILIPSFFISIAAESACNQSKGQFALTEEYGDFNKEKEYIQTSSVLTLPICNYGMSFSELTKKKTNAFETAVLGFYSSLFNKKVDTLKSYLKMEDHQRSELFLRQFEFITKKNPVYLQTHLYSAIENENGTSFYLEFRDQGGQGVMNPLVYGFVKDNSSGYKSGLPKGLEHELFFKYQNPSKKIAPVDFNRVTHKLDLEENIKFYFKVMDLKDPEFKKLGDFFFGLVQVLKQRKLDEFYLKVGPVDSWKKAFEPGGESALKLTEDYYGRLKLLAAIDIDPLVIAYASLNGKVINSVMRFRRTPSGYLLINENKFDLPYRIYNHSKLKEGALESVPFASFRCIAAGKCPH